MMQLMSRSNLQGYSAQSQRYLGQTHASQTKGKTSNGTERWKAQTLKIPSAWKK